MPESRLLRLSVIRSPFDEGRQDMTSLNYYQGVDRILQRLDAVRLRLLTLRVLIGVLAVLTVVMGCVLTVGVAAGYWPDQPPAALRWSLLIGACVAMIGSIAWFLGRAVLWRQNPAQVARFVEQALPEVRNDLINTVLLSRDRSQVSPELVQMAIHEAARRAERLDLTKSVSLKSLGRWGIVGGALALVLTVFGIFQGGHLKRGLAAVLSPRAYVAPVNTIQLIDLSPKDTTIFRGESVTIMAKVRNDDRAPLQAQLIVPKVADLTGEPGEQSDARAQSHTYSQMIASEDNCTFTCQKRPVEETFQYAVRIGDSKWPTDKPYYTVTVINRIEIEGLDLRYDYPPYTGLESKTVPNADGAIEAPVGSLATVTLRLRSAAPGVALAMQDAGDWSQAAPLGETAAGPAPSVPNGPERLMDASADKKTFTIRLRVVKDGAYRLLLKDPSGNTIQQLPDPGSGAQAEAFSAAGQLMLKGYYTIHAVPDLPPKVECIVPGRDVTVAPGGKVSMKIKASDTYGLTALSLRAGLQGQPNGEADVTDFSPGSLAGKKEIEASYTFDLSKYKENDVITYYAMATDNRKLDAIGLPGHQDANSNLFKITVQDADKVSAEKAKRYEELRQLLLGILRLQETQRVNTSICQKRHTELAQVKATGGTILAGQREIKAKMLDVVDKFPFDQDWVSIQQALAMLANNEAQLAIDQSQVVAALSDMPSRDKACELLGDTQSKIIETLQNLLGHMASLAGKPESTTKPVKGADLPPEVQEKLKALQDALQEFIKEEKKVIQASERLAKKPVDAFTPEDMKLVHDLAATQDKWEKFINEAMTDLSKLAQQDFSNPVVMKELVSVKSDVTMAKDALKEKATEIATAAEDNGIENAKSLTANIEKWLPDKPDRQKWSMEDPKDGQTNPEQAELPTELEDLVGDLLEQEEDLFEDMEDLNSKYAQSGDKGIGWDAMDGPISNMNAQGVTGNQLPNNNELQGRSGEGRSGKSSGEFVEDKAVGKGGRRTPTRLTQDGFQKGEVNDQSKEQAGGATGGGKISGSGEEGLEGPIPPPLEKEMQRLAGKQAALVNKAERMRAQYQTADHASIKLLQSITLMNRVRSDLESYRYHNALRTGRGTVDALRQTKLMLSGQVDVSADSTSNMPKYVRDDISDAMKGKMPDEFKDVLEQYYRRLSEQGGK